MKRLILLLVAASFVFAADAVAEEKFEDLLERATSLRAEGKYPQAMAELNWAQEQLKKAHTEKLKSFFPGEVSGFSAEDFKAANALGMTSIERTYKHSGGAQVKAALVGGSGGAAGGGMGALAGFAQMAARMGGENTENVRLGNKRATITEERGRKKMIVSLNSGMMFNLEVKRGDISNEDLTTLAEGVDFAKLESYLQTN